MRHHVSPNASPTKLLSFSAKVYASPASPTFLFKIIYILFIKKVGDAGDAQDI